MLFNNMVNQGKGASMMMEKKMDKQVKYNGGGRSAGTKRLLRTTVIFLLASALLLSSCSGPGETAAATPTATQMEQTTGTPAPTVVATPSPTPTPTPKRYEDMTWQERFASKFTNGEVVKTDTSYKSANVSVEITKTQLHQNEKNALTYFVADIYISDVQYLKTAAAGGNFNKPKAKHVTEIAKEVGNTIVAVNGDYYIDNGCRAGVRNGELYELIYESSDLLILYSDGTMETVPGDEINTAKLEIYASMGKIYQIWSFGPMLIDDGKPMTEFNSHVKVANPRAAIGYYEPGHYCFVVVEGRQQGYSEGFTMEELSDFMCNTLGCSVAYNLDGGASAEMAVYGELYSQPSYGGRPISDIIYITDTVEEPAPTGTFVQ